ncbi:MAG: FAD-dependent oxidoreductase [Adlercreutzia equolifaciens]
MTEINAKGLSRRAFFGLGATAAAGAAVAGLAGCSPAPQSDAAAPATTGDTTMPATGTATYEWEIAPEPITDIASTVDTDILVIGAGLSGCACAAAAAEKGGKVTVVEKTGSFNGRGGGFGAINSRYMEAQNIVVDKVNAKQHWIAQCASRTNEDHYREVLQQLRGGLQLAHRQVRGLGRLRHGGRVLQPRRRLRRAAGIPYVHDPRRGRPHLHRLRRCRAVLPGRRERRRRVRVRFPCRAAREGRLRQGVRLHLRDLRGLTVQYNAAKGVVLATGDIGGSPEMCEAYAPICAEYGQPRSQYTPAGVNTGDGHKMGMWVGAQLQDLPFPTMMHPQAFCWFHGPFLFVNDNGERFMCEDTWVQGKSLAINKQPNGEAWSVFDANWPTDLVNGLPYGGGMFWDSFRPYGSDLELAPEYFKTQIPLYIEQGMAYEADTIEELAGKIGCDAATLTATVDRYNGMCEAGEDTDYHKKPVFLTPVKQGPFYALKVGPALLAVCGGLKCNNDFQCLDENGEVIEGLYVLGNIMGDITAVDYPINVAGNSHGRCITFGYLLGHELAEA